MDTIDNLEDWGRVLDELERWTRMGQLDERQEQLLWLLRYPDNWRLREAALESMRSMRAAGPRLIEEACRIMMDDGLYYQVRVLAAEALAAAFGEGKSAGAESEPLSKAVRDQMRALLDSPQPPIMHQALQRVLPNFQ
jgi:hypothetical protein